MLKDIMHSVPAANPFKQNLMAIYAGVATSFLSLGLAIELDHHFLAVAFAGEILALSWINTRVDIAALRKFIVALGGAFVVLIAPEILRLIPEALEGLVQSRLSHNTILGISGSAVVQLGLPALCLGGSSWLLRKKEDDYLVQALEAGGVLLAGVMGYVLMHQVFHIGDTGYAMNVSFFERTMVTNMFFALGFAGLIVGRKASRVSLSLCGVALCGLAVARVCYYDYAIYNPLWSAQNVGEWPVINALLIAYGLPIFWTWMGHREISLLGRETFSRRLGLLSLVLAFTLVTFNVRQFFHGARLDLLPTTDGEIYTYSVVWLLFGVGLLVLGTVREIKEVRVASLAVMALTIGKVFLYDASALTGLWRVFSFAGLGLSLLALSWFYTRFVFKTRS